MSSSFLFDNRVGCISLIAEFKVSDYLNLVEDAYRDKGGIAGQRGALKTTSARRIRDRMVEDISKGAVLPPVVVGLVTNSELFQKWRNFGDARISEIIIDIQLVDKSHISIIDGMQRTTALLEAANANPNVLELTMRVEFWISEAENALIYRMLVLNTGQIPWDIKRQISVVFDTVIQTIKGETNVSRVLFQHEGRRFNPGEYTASDLAELYMAFGSRKINVDTQEYLADEFSKIDIIDAIADNDFVTYFYPCLDIMVEIDRAFSRFRRETDEKTGAGRRVFDKQTARIGLIVAIAVTAFGRAGAERQREDKERRFDLTKRQATEFCVRLNKLDMTQLDNFLRLGVLDELLTKRVSQVGRYERQLFYEAFRVLVEENFSVNNMEECWRAYV